MQAGDPPKSKCTFFIHPLSSCLVHFFSLYQLFQVWPMWWWCCELSTWWVFTIWGATHLLVIGPPPCLLNFHKEALTSGPLFLQKVIWPFMCTVVRRAHFFFYVIFHFIFKLWAKATFEFAYPTPLSSNLEKNLERKCVYSITHTHTHIKNQNQAFIETTESSL